MNNQLRVYWIPQVGSIVEPFYVPVENVYEAKKVMNILSAYDAFQLQNRIKPDYCNTGGLEIFDEEEGEWVDWFIETDDGYFDDIDEYLDSIDKSNKHDSFEKELFKQIDWNQISQMIG